MEILEIAAVALGGGGLAWATLATNQWWKARDSARADNADKREGQKDLREQTDWLIERFEKAAKTVGEQLDEALKELDGKSRECARCKRHVRKAAKTWKAFISEARIHLAEMPDNIAAADRVFQEIEQEYENS